MAKSFQVTESLAGVWYNELCSEMRINSQTDKEGTLQGTYQTAVGNVPPDKIFPLVGTYDISGDESKGTVSFVVQWSQKPPGENTNSTTAWSGQRIKVDKESTISTTWLLTTQKSSDDLWSATNIGTNVFTRTQPPQCAANPLPIHCCHPKKIHPK
jgi:hypothetical protein